MTIEDEKIEAVTQILDLVTESVYVLVPKQHIGILLADYLYRKEVLNKEEDRIVELNVPIETDDEGNITIKVGVIKGVAN